MCRNITEQLTARFLHVLILRLAFACEHPDDLAEIELSCSAQKLFMQCFSLPGGPMVTLKPLWK